MKSLHVEFDIPSFLAQQVGLDPKNVSTDAQRLLALFLYEHGQISLGKACELAGLSHWEFVELNQKWGIEMRYSEAELSEDLQRLANV